MSKRHQSSRRKTYGRRQHELRQRSERGRILDSTDHGLDDGRNEAPDAFVTHHDPMAFRFQFAGD